MTTYIERVLWTLLKTSFTKNSFCYLLISLITIILRTHVDAILASIFTTPSYILNFIIRMTISCWLVINSKYLYDIVVRYKPEIYNLVKYLINNYTSKNFKRWKRKVTIFCCVYLYIATFFVEISNSSIRQTIIEYLICYVLIELYYNYMKGELKIFNNKEFECNTNSDDNIIDNLIKKNDDLIDNDLFDIKK